MPGSNDMLGSIYMKGPGDKDDDYWICSRSLGSAANVSVGSRKKGKTEKGSSCPPQVQQSYVGAFRHDCFSAFL